MFMGFNIISTSLNYVWNLMAQSNYTHKVENAYKNAIHLFSSLMIKRSNLSHSFVSSLFFCKLNHFTILNVKKSFDFRLPSSLIRDCIPNIKNGKHLVKQSETLHFIH